jgi:hypothetical protein
LFLKTDGAGNLSFSSDLPTTSFTGATVETSIADSDLVLIYDDSATAVRKMTKANLVAGISDNFSTKLLHVRDEKSSGTTGGTFTSGSFQTRDLNTSLTNEISGASLSSNQIILPSGTYYIDATAPAFQIDKHKAKLRNITDSSDTLIGTSEFSQYFGAYTTTSFVTGRFTIASQKTFELQHRCETTLATNGLGVDGGFSVTAVYTDVKIWKVA